MILTTGAQVELLRDERGWQLAVFDEHGLHTANIPQSTVVDIAASFYGRRQAEHLVWGPLL